MEYLDIYDEHAHKTGRVIVRGTPVKQGEYSMSVHLYIYNYKGEFLLQKRSRNKRSLPGVWSVTCGAVSSGENSTQAGVREAAEEVGLIIRPEDMEFVGRIKKRRSFIDIYFVKKDFSLSDCVLQEEEVDEVRFAEPREVLAVIGSSERVNSSYSAAVEHAMRRNHLL